MTDYMIDSPLRNLEQQAQTALDNIEAERATLANGPTNAQVIAILDNILNRQAKEIKALRKLIRKADH